MFFKYALKIILLPLLCKIVVAKTDLEEVFAWKQVDFITPSQEQHAQYLKDGTFKPENNLPLGVERWKNKVFVTVPRWKDGVLSSLNYVTLSNDGNKSPALIPYPSLNANQLPKMPDSGVSNDTIISTFRVRADECDRLWVIDSGLADILGTPTVYTRPSIIIFDLNTDMLLHRYELRLEDTDDKSFFANIVVDTNKESCEKAFAYLTDLGGNAVVVYDLAKNKSWRVQHNYFHFDPLYGDYNINGINFQWTDGVFGLALSPPQMNGFRTAYFHALSSTKEFMVSTDLLQNEEAATNAKNYYQFKLLGNRGDGTQASASFLDQQTGVLFFTQVTRNGVGCWNMNKAFTPENIALVACSNTTLVFPNDLKVDSDGYLWVLSDRMPNFLYDQLDPNEVNYRIMRAKISDLISDTVCQ